MQVKICLDIKILEVDMWDPAQYQRYSDERSRPFFELLARVHATSPRYVVDLGCGPGHLTAALAERWPDAQVDGVDNSPQMLEAARATLAGCWPRPTGAQWVPVRSRFTMATSVSSRPPAPWT